MSTTLPLIRRKSVLALKTESTAGTFESSIAAADVTVKTYNVELKTPKTPIERAKQGGLGRDISMYGDAQAALTFMGYVHGKGSSGVPNWATLLLPACGIPLNTGQTYATTDTQSAWSTLSARHFIDGVKKSARGLMGNLKFTFENGRPVQYDAEFKGGWVEDRGTTSLVAGTYESIALPRWEGSASTTFSANAVRIDKVELDLGNDVQPVEDSTADGGYRMFILTDRVPKVTISPEAATAVNWYAAQGSLTTFDLTLVVGTASNNTITFVLNALALDKSPEDADRNGKLVDALGFDVTGGISIAFS